MPDVMAEQLRQTQQLIDYETHELQLRRKEPGGRTPAGGPSRAPEFADLPSTLRCFFGAKTRDGMPLQDTQGDRIIFYYVIVAMPGADVAKGDVFTLDGNEFTVTYVHRNLPYEVRAEVETYGGR
jgi:hypothetical protein